MVVGVWLSSAQAAACPSWVDAVGWAVDDASVGEPELEVFGVTDDLDAGGVFEVVVVTAEQRHVDQVAQPASLDQVEVVDLTPRGGIDIGLDSHRRGS
ncbi:MAG: hypothetical protein U0Q03_17740 [Acidimicrobiales bacterium]